MNGAALMKVFTFNSVSLTFSERDGEWWLSAREVADALGYPTHREVGRLYNRNAKNFKPGESVVVRLTTSDGKAKPQRAFSPRGLMRLAIHAGTPRAVEFHDFVVDHLEKLRTGERVLVDPEKLMARINELSAEVSSLRGRLVESHKAHAFAVEKAMDNVQSITKDAFSAIASALAKRGALKKAEKKLLGEIKEGQKFLPGLGGHVNRIESDN